MVRALGANEVVDYTKQDFVERGGTLRPDAGPGRQRALSDCQSVLLPKGTYVACSGGGGDWFGPLFRIAGVLLASLFTSQKLTTFVVSPDQKDLLFLKELVEAGREGEAPHRASLRAERGYRRAAIRCRGTRSRTYRHADRGRRKRPIQ
jgi:hypothetical protein